MARRSTTDIFSKGRAASARCRACRLELPQSVPRGLRPMPLPMSTGSRAAARAAEPTRPNMSVKKRKATGVRNAMWPLLRSEFGILLPPKSPSAGVRGTMPHSPRSNVRIFPVLPANENSRYLENFAQNPHFGWSGSALAEARSISMLPPLFGRLKVVLPGTDVMPFFG